MSWDLTPLYASIEDPKLFSDCETVDAALAALQTQIFAADPHGQPEAFLPPFLASFVSAYTVYYNIRQFVHLLLSTDGTNQDALRFVGRIESQPIAIAKIISAVSLYLSKVHDLEHVIDGDPLLRENRFILLELCNKAFHLLDPAIEPWILRMQLSGGIAWGQLRNMLDATHSIPFEVDGSPKQLALSEIRNLAYDGDADIRKRAYEAEIAAYPKIEIPMAAALSGIKGEALILCEAKRYDSVLQMTLDETRMDQQTLEAMLEAIQESLPDFRRYFKAKAHALGYEGGLKFYDLFAPIGKQGKTYSPEEARAYIINALSTFSPEMGQFVDNAFAERWIDLFPHQGKRGGAFCSGNHALERSWILTNYGGFFSDISTLAHELGHAFHQDCIKNKPVLMSDYPMQLAETASIFNETLLMEHATAAAADNDELLGLLDGSITDSAQVIVDIYSRYLFETEVFEARKDHAPTPEELKDIMQRAQLNSYGDGLASDALHPYMWACKPHYYSTGLHFYNFPYAFGLLFGLGIYTQYQQQGSAYVPIYQKLLAETGSDTIANVAACVGIDVHDISFWRSSLDIIRKKIDRFVSLVGKEG